MDSANAQPPTPLPMKARIFQVVLAEKWVEFEEIEAKLVGADTSKYSATKVQAYRENVKKAIEGGKLYIVVDVGGTKKTWIGAVTSASSPSEGSAAASDAGVPDAP